MAMAPSSRSNDDHSSSSHSIYTFPTQMPLALSMATTPSTTVIFGSKDGAATVKPGPLTPARPPNVSTVTKPSSHFVSGSPIPASAASFNLHRRLLLPALAMPTIILLAPPLATSAFSFLAYRGTQTVDGRDYGGFPTFLAVTLILASAWLLERLGRGAIERHAPNEASRKKALAQSSVALPFWSLVISIVVGRNLFTPLGGGEDTLEYGEPGGWINWIWGLVSTSLFWTVKVARACVGPALGWTIISLSVVVRYAGPFFPIVRCSTTPLRTNPFDAALQRLGRNFMSKALFLDMVADGLDKLSAPSAPLGNTKINNQTKPGDVLQSHSANQMNSLPSVAGPHATTASAIANAANNQRIVEPSNANAGVGRIVNLLISSYNTRYSRPGLLSILVQVLVNTFGGNLLAQAYILPLISRLIAAEHGSTSNSGSDSNAILIIIWISCLLVPVFELFSSVNEAELHYSHYTLPGGGGQPGRGFRLWPVLVALARDVMHRVRRSIFGVTVLALAFAVLCMPLCAFILSDSAFMLVIPSSSATLNALFISYLTVALIVTVMAVQDVLTRWAVCAPGMDADVLMFRTPMIMAKSIDASTFNKFLAEDLFVQSILMGDVVMIDKVITPPRAESNPNVPFTSHQDDELARNETALALFSEWIQQSSTIFSGKLSDDILRMSLLESLGGGGSADPRLSHPFYFGTDRHTDAVRKRLHLSANTTSPGSQPIAVPVVRALCAFAGGTGYAMSQIYRQLDKDGKLLRKNVSSELWKLPPAALNAMEFAIIAATRLVVMNSVMIEKHVKHGRAIVNLKRHDRLSLLLPCILHSAYNLRCGIHEFARATANQYEVNLSAYDRNGMGDGLGNFIATKCPNLCPVISACNDSAKMVMKTLMESGDRSLEDVLLRRKWKGDMKQWLVRLNCDDLASESAT